MDFFLQLWGALFYLINKAFFALGEGKEPQTKKQFKVGGWLCYIIGVPAWVIILLGHHNWIAASIEAGGVPAMFLGLYQIYFQKTAGSFFQNIVRFFTYGSLIFGLSFSCYHHGGLTSLSQTLEIGVMVGFLLGGYLLAKNNRLGWLFFMLMNLSMAGLMMLQGKSILLVQQLLSLSFVIYGFIRSRNSLK